MGRLESGRVYPGVNYEQIRATAAFGDQLVRMSEYLVESMARGKKKVATTFHVRYADNRDFVGGWTRGFRFQGKPRVAWLFRVGTVVLWPRTVISHFRHVAYSGTKRYQEDRVPDILQLSSRLGQVRLDTG